jgi:hypothetical protein
MSCRSGASFLALLVPGDPARGYRAGQLSEEVYALWGITTTCRVVGVVQSALAHIWAGRGEDDANIVFDGRTGVFERPLYAGRNRGRLWIVGAVAEHARYVCLMLKFVPVSSSRMGVDELWISTGFTMGDRRLTEYVGSGILKKLWGDTEGGKSCPAGPERVTDAG